MNRHIFYLFLTINLLIVGSLSAQSNIQDGKFTGTQGSCPLAISSYSVTAPTCSNAYSGVARLIAVNGSMAYDFTWTGGTLINSVVHYNKTGKDSLTGYGAGTYTVTVKDSTGYCTVQQIITIPAAIPPTVSANVTNVSCLNGANGSITVNASSGNGPLVYYWSDGGVGASSKTGLTAGSYTIMVTDAGGCSQSTSAIITSPTTVLTLSNISASPALCGIPVGSVSILPYGGTAPYSYSWSMGQTTQNISNLVSGYYFVTVTDNNGCSVTAAAQVTATVNPIINLSATNPPCAGFATGSVTSTPTGGIAPYAYKWSTGATSSVLTSLTAGTYSLTVTDNNGCFSSSSVTITTPTPLSLLLSPNAATCGQANGIINATNVGGTLPYTYLWSNNAKTNNVANLSVGNYTLTVSDANGCNATSTAKVDSLPIPRATIQNIVNISCNGGSNGSLTVSPISGTTPYKYAWSGTASSNTSNQATNLLAGTYTVTISDANTCTATISATITQPLALVLNTTPLTTLTCNNSSGTISTTLSGGNSPYTYAWSTGATTQNITASTSGSYTITVTDNNGCSSTSTANVIDNTTSPTTNAAKTIVKSVSCNGLSDGAVYLSVSSTNDPLSFTCSNGASGSANVNNLLAGTYTVTITDNNSGCISVQAFQVIQPLKLSATFTGSTGLLNGCNGNLSAEASGGTSPYTYSWSNYYNVPVVTNVCPGNYVLTVTDANGCTSISNASLHLDSVNFPNPTPLVVYMNLKDASGPAVCDGTANPFVTGGTPPYQFLYSDQLITQTHQGLCPGVYSLRVTDYKEQKDSVSFVISSPKTTYVDSSKKNIALTDSVIQATLNNKAINNCTAFNTSIDSIRISDYYLVKGTDSVEVDWYIFHKTAVDSVHQRYPISVAGVYTVILQLYCVLPIAKTEAVAGVLKGVGHVYITPEALTTGISNQAYDPTNTASLVYPNPFNSTVTIQFTTQNKYIIQVYDITGNKVMEDLVSNGSPTNLNSNNRILSSGNGINGNSIVSTQILDLSKLKAGTYLLNIITPAATEYHKLVKAD